MSSTAWAGSIFPHTSGVVVPSQSRADWAISHIREGHKSSIAP